MGRFTEAARELLERQPAPALSVPELKDLMEGELPDSGLELLGPPVLERLVREAEDLRLITPPELPWLKGLGPEGWVLKVRGPGTTSRHSRGLPERVRAALRRLGRVVDTDSVLSWARWNRLLEEEKAVRRYLRPPRPAPRRAPPPRRRKRARTTSRLPDPPPGR